MIKKLKTKEGQNIKKKGEFYYLNIKKIKKYINFSSRACVQVWILF